MTKQLLGFLIGSLSFAFGAHGQALGPGVHGARAAALSNASAAISGEVWAIGNNVAGLGSLNAPTVGFYAENRYFSAALNVAALAVALPVGAVTPGATPTQPAQAKNGVAGLEVQRFGGSLYNETRAGLGYGYRFGLISLGARVDMLQVSIEGLGSRRVALGSLGGQMELLPNKLAIGVSLYNLNQAKLANYQDERVPTILKAGLAYRPSAQVLLLAETEKDVERDANFKAGLEYRPVPLLAARVGLASLTEQASAGLGLQAKSLELSYAAAYQQNLGFSHHLSVAKTWKGKGQ